MIELIAEIGWNHMGDMGRAKAMIRQASDSGANYAKFQTWRVSRLTKGPWDEDGRRKIYEQAELSDDQHLYLADTCKEYGIKFLTSCFCIDDIDFISSVCDAVKIPSTECRNKDLVNAAIEKFDRVFISTGATLEEEYSYLAKCDKVTLLHCVSAYPCDASKVNMGRMLSLKALGGHVGYSGHYDGIWDAILAVSLGAKVIEKHFTVDKNLPGRDNKFALVPSELKQISEYISNTNKMMYDHGTNFQTIEAEAREIYNGRWSNC